MAIYKMEIHFSADDRLKIPEIVGYIKQELAAAGGCRDPSDPLFVGLRVSRVVCLEKIGGVK